MSKDPFAGLEPAPLWSHFADLVKIPRPSGQETAVREWLADWAFYLRFWKGKSK